VSIQIKGGPIGYPEEQFEALPPADIPLPAAPEPEHQEKPQPPVKQPAKKVPVPA